MKTFYILQAILLLSTGETLASEGESFENFQSPNVYSSTGSNLSMKDTRITNEDLKLSDEVLGSELIVSDELDNHKLSSKSIEIDEEEEIDEDEFYEDDFSDLGIDMKQVLSEAPVKEKELPSLPVVPEKKIDLSVLQLSCDEFTGRIENEAFPLCGILVKDNKNSRLELTMDEVGKISSYSSTIGLIESKRLCLSGYIASKPAKSVGTNFTCRILL